MIKYAVHYQFFDEEQAPIHIYYCRAKDEDEAEKNFCKKHDNILIVDVVEADNAPEDLFFHQ